MFSQDTLTTKHPLGTKEGRQENNWQQIIEKENKKIYKEINY